MRKVLALHCSLASGAAWRGVAEYLPDAPLVCPDLPGHGRAEPWDTRRDFQDQALERVLAEAGRGPMDVVGHSFGGCLGLRLLAERPGLVRSLTLIEPVMFAAADRETFAAHWREMSPFRKAMSLGDRLCAARIFHGLWGDGRLFDSLPERTQEAMAARIHTVPATEPAIVRDVHRTLDRLPASPPPVLIVTRERPPAIVASIAEGMVSRLSGAQSVTLGRGHMIPMEMPGALAETLLRFWRR